MQSRQCNHICVNTIPLWVVQNAMMAHCVYINCECLGQFMSYRQRQQRTVKNVFIIVLRLWGRHEWPWRSWLYQKIIMHCSIKIQTCKLTVSRSITIIDDNYIQQEADTLLWSELLQQNRLIHSPTYCLKQHFLLYWNFQTCEKVRSVKNI